jgi:hypothetical protein
MSGVERFVKGVQSEFGVRPVIPFGAPIEIGDIGRIGDDGAWQPLSSTQHRFGVAPSNVRDEKPNEEVWDMTSGHDASFKVYADGQTSKLFTNVADAKARAEISFKSADSFVFASRDMDIHTASELSAVLEAIRRAYHLRRDLPEAERWEKDYVFVFATVDAQRFTALVAKESGTDIAVTGEGQVGPPAAAADLALGVSVGVSSKQVTKDNAHPAPSRFFRGYRLNPGIFTRWDREEAEELRGIVAPSKEDRLAKLEALPLPPVDEAFDEVGSA